jgi:hypothetical protein
MALALYSGLDQRIFEEEEENPYERDALLSQMGGGSGTTGQGFESGERDPNAPTTSYQTSGFAPPKTTTTGGNVLSGWDATKWGDASHQTPKYVVGRIMSEGDTKTEEGRAAILARIQEAYPDATFSGKDRLTIPSLGLANIDIYGNASGGEYTPTWQDPRDAGGAGSRPSGYYGPNTAQWGNAVAATLAPDDWGTYEDLQRRLVEILGGAPLDRNALMAQMKK